MVKPTDRSSEGGPRVSRRGLLRGSAASGAAAFGNFAAGAAEAQQSQETGSTAPTVTFSINGSERTATLDARTTLLDYLREDLDLTGTKVGCNHAQCGACTVLIDGTRVNSCLTLMATLDGAEITTIEGLDSEGDLHPMQQAFIDNDGFQCGYCTPGQIMSAIGCVREGHAGSAPEIREYMSGNLCRCGAYKGIVAAVEQARDQVEEAG